MISFLWEVCVPYEFVSPIYTSPNYQIIADPKLNFQNFKKNQNFQKANQIVIKWITSYEMKHEICQKIKENFKNIHYNYSSLYPKIYNRLNQFGIKIKSEFELAFTCYKIQKNKNDNQLKQSEMQSLFSGKNPDVYQKRNVVKKNVVLK